MLVTSLTKGVRMHWQSLFCRGFCRLAALVMAGGSWTAAGLVAADTPEKSWHWRAIAMVEQPVTHSVLLQDTVSGDLRRRNLVGPEALVMVAAGDACLCQYPIDPVAVEQPAGRFRLRLRGRSEPVIVVVGPPCAALLPAQLLRDGPPAGEPGQLVYEQRKILAVASGQGGDLAAICLPVEYRHHFERLQPGDQAAAFAVRQPVEAAAEGSYGIVDDLGTNRITLKKSRQGIIPVEQFEVIP